jgi:hypothetical protein
MAVIVNPLKLLEVTEVIRGFLHNYTVLIGYLWASISSKSPLPASIAKEIGIHIFELVLVHQSCVIEWFPFQQGRWATPWAALKEVVLLFQQHPNAIRFIVFKVGVTSSEEVTARLNIWNLTYEIVLLYFLLTLVLCKLPGQELSTLSQVGLALMEVGVAIA